MAYPDLYDVTYSYTGFQQSQGDNSFPGTQMDADLAGLQSSVFGWAAFTQKVIRSDGALKNGIVTYDSLAPALQTAGLAPAVPWVTATVYIVGVAIIQSGSVYRSLVTHTSGVFATDLAAGKWQFLYALTVGPAGPPGNMDGTHNLSELTNIALARRTIGINQAEPLANAIDFNTVVAPGTYYTSTTTSSNNPLSPAVNYWHLEVGGPGGGYVWQEARLYLGTPQRWVREMMTGAWGAWQRLATFDDLSAGSVAAPQGRVTLTSGVSILQANVAAATRIYWTPDGGGMVPIYGGSSFGMVAFPEVYQDTTDTTKSPGAVAASKIYDEFLWVDSGTPRKSRGPDWAAGAVAGSNASGAAFRGQGAGSTELIWVKGIPLNRYDIVNGPAAQRGTAVATFFSNASSTVDFKFGTLNGAGGVAGVLGVWNFYNRAQFVVQVQDNTDSWSSATAAGWRAANNSATARVTMVRGLDVDPVEASYKALGFAGASMTMAAGVGIDTTTAVSGRPGFNAVAGAPSREFTSDYSGLVGLGLHYVSANEYNSGATASTFVGDGGSPGLIQAGLTVKVWA